MAVVPGATSHPTFLSLDLHFHSSSPAPSLSSSSSSSFFLKSPLSHNFPLLTRKPCPLSPFLCCYSTKSPPVTAEPPPVSPSNSFKNNPSLSDQLRPLSLTLLKEKQQEQEQEQTPPLLSHKPKSTWVNPSRPKPKVLSLQRHKRSPYSYNPELKHLTLISRKLSECNVDLSSFSASLQEALPEPPTRENALLILNNLKPWQKTYQFFNWLKTQDLFPIETIFYNVTMKSLRFGKQYHLVESLANEMINRGIELDNITYSTIITCFKRCRQFDKAINWFDRIYKTGKMPDEVTYSAILDVYAKMGKVEEVISLYERGRASGWNPDPVAFSVLGKMFGEAGDYDGIQFVLQEMKGLGVEPNLVVYNTLLEAMGKAGKPGLARSLFEEMVSIGLTPNEKTLTALIKIYGKARWSRDALGLWERMRLNHWPMDFILYNTLLSMCADLGLEEEAENLFAEMKGSEHTRPDSWSYTAMINIYASGAKEDKALELFGEMLENEVDPNVMGITCLIQCLGKARRIEDAVRVFGVAMKEGVKPDDRLCGCLLSVVGFCEEGEMGKVLACLEKVNPRLVGFVKMLTDEKIEFDVVKEEFRGILNATEVEARRPFCNCLIDICRNQKFPLERAHEIFHLGTLYGLYPGLYSNISNEWCLNLRSLSVGAAHIAFEEWVKTLSSCVEQKEALPQLFSVNTGSGTHKFSQGLARTFALHLKHLAVPFQQNEEKAGYFVASKEDLVSWVQGRV